MYILYFYLIFLARYNQAVWLNYFSLKFRCILLNLKSLHRYDWIALLDVDEVIVPRKLHTSWAEMMEEVKEHTLLFHLRFVCEMLFLQKMAPFDLL